MKRVKNMVKKKNKSITDNLEPKFHVTTIIIIIIRYIVFFYFSKNIDYTPLTNFYYDILITY